MSGHFRYTHSCIFAIIYDCGYNAQYTIPLAVSHITAPTVIGSCLTVNEGVGRSCCPIRYILMESGERLVHKGAKLRRLSTIEVEVYRKSLTLARSVEVPMMAINFS